MLSPRLGHLPFVGEKENVVDNILQLVSRHTAVIVDVSEPKYLSQVLLGRPTGQAVDDEHEPPEADDARVVGVENFEDVLLQTLQLLEVWVAKRHLLSERPAITLEL